jgi:hypothetical protein
MWENKRIVLCLKSAHNQGFPELSAGETLYFSCLARLKRRLSRAVPEAQERQEDHHVPDLHAHAESIENQNVDLRR